MPGALPSTAPDLVVHRGMKLTPAHVALPLKPASDELKEAQASMQLLKLAVKSDINGALGALELQNMVKVTLLKTAMPVKGGSCET